MTKRQHVSGKIKVLFFSLVMLFTLSKLGQAEVAIGLGYPYLEVKGDLFEDISAELKYAYSDGISVYAGRGYWRFFRIESLNTFVGAEFGGIGFHSLDLNGQGIEYGLFAGGEYRIFKSIGLSLDIGPSMVQLSAQNTGMSGVEWVVNAGIYWYIF